MSGSQTVPNPSQQREGTDVNDERSTRETDQRFAELRDIADSLGLVVTGRCMYCNQPIWDPKSLAVQAGSVCRTRHKDKNDLSEHSGKSTRTEAA